MKTLLANHLEVLKSPNTVYGAEVYFIAARVIDRNGDSLHSSFDCYTFEDANNSLNDALNRIRAAFIVTACNQHAALARAKEIQP